MAVFPEHGTDVATLLMHADTAKHQARATGSSEVVVYTNEMSEHARERMALDAELRYAVRNEQLTLHFQPKIRIADGTLVGVEALLRWFHPELGPISPVRFIPIAEDSELILEMGRWVLRAACRQLRAWRDAGLETTIAVNVSGKQFVHDDPAREIALAARESGVEPSSIIVEITESMVMSDLAPVQAGLAATRRIGCRVAVDDFGTGSSSLAYLRELPIDELKVDRLFIARVDDSPVDAAIFAAVLSLARSLSLPVTAEGVETVAQLEWLRSNGCDHAQGYLLAKPMEGHRVLELYGPRQRVSGVQVA
jgi:EAL domain-containing protein (putative c-di-GMP-specific phosphodiesterase class I)